MKKRLLGFLLGVMLISVCVGCGAESTATEQADTSTTALEEECTTEPVKMVEKETLSLEESSEQVSGITTDSSEDTKNETELAEKRPADSKSYIFRANLQFIARTPQEKDISKETL